MILLENSILAHFGYVGSTNGIFNFSQSLCFRYRGTIPSSIILSSLSSCRFLLIAKMIDIDLTTEHI